MDFYEEPVAVPRGGVRFPLELRPPPGFRPDDPSTWPKTPARLEWVGGRLWLMPPCGDIQSDVSCGVSDVVLEWVRSHPDFHPGNNETGMILGGEVRGAEAAIWRSADLGPRTGGHRRVPPILAVEVTGRDEGETELREKAAWYLSRGVCVVWIVLCETREVLVVTKDRETRHGRGTTLPGRDELPGLNPEVDRFFSYLDR